MDVLEAPILFEPQLLPKPWGGGEQLRAFGVAVPEGPPVGEIWLVSDVPGRSSRISAGTGRGGTLEELLRRHGPAVLGGASAPAGRFPLLVKLLEIRGRLSVQVHPDAQQARAHGDGPSGKFEAWSVLGAAPEARVALGFDRELRPEEVKELVAAARLDERLNVFEPRPGDAYVISPGCVHAAWGGLLLLEVQETADVTYRLYDWGSVGLDGRPRELHVAKSLAVAKLAPFSPRRPVPPAARTIASGVRARTIIPAGAGPLLYEQLELAPGARTAIGGDDRPWVVVGLTGGTALTPASSERTFVHAARAELRAGEAALWPAAAGPLSLSASEASSCAIAAPAVSG